jgi:TolB-like protein
MYRRWAGALGGVLLFAAAGAAHADRPKILVLPVTGKATDPGFRQRVTQSLSEGLIASGGEVVAPGTSVPAEGCATPACLAGAARATGAAYLLRASVEEAGRSYLFKLEMLDGQSGAVLAQRENRCEICTDAEALEIANAAASALKAQALKRPGPPAPGAAGAATPGTTAAAPGAATAPEKAAGPRARVGVVDKLELPASLAEFHGKLRTALEALVREQGLEVVTAPAAPTPACTGPDCQKDQLRDAGASHVLYVEGSRNDYGFSLDITLRGVSGDDSEKAQGWCNFCTGPQMVTAAENVARPLVVHLAARPERAPGLATGARGTDVTARTGEGKGGSSTARLLVGIGLAAAGAATVAVGAVTWSRAGDDTDCAAPMGGTSMTPVCRGTYGGKPLGIAMTVGGGVLVGVGAWLILFRDTKDTHVAVGPNSVAVTGRF